MSAPTLLQIRDLQLAFGAVVALDDVSFDVERGSIHAVIGPNGAGKSSLFNVVSGLYRPQRGTVTLDGQELTTMSPHAVARHGVARAFQNIALSGELDVLANLMIGQHTQLSYGPFTTVLRGPRFRRQERSAVDRARRIAAMLGLERYLDTRVDALPYGVRKRVDVTRALCMEPTLLLLDEPAAGLTAEDRGTVRSMLATLRDSLAVTVLLVEHDVPLVLDVADHITVLDFGRVIADGEPEAVRQDPRVIEAYLGGDPTSDDEQSFDDGSGPLTVAVT